WPRLHPRYTLFPYTTLFRSRVSQHFLRRLDVGFRLAIRIEGLDHRFDFGALARKFAKAIHIACDFGLGEHRVDFDQTVRQLLEPDRKSTRLNSSHVKISYAV